MIERCWVLLSHPPHCRVRSWASQSQTRASVIKQYNLVLVEGGDAPKLGMQRLTEGLVSQSPCVTNFGGISTS